MQRRFLSLLIALFIIISSFAQKAKLEGKVSDSQTGNALVGVTIEANGVRTMSDVSGQYSLSLTPGDKIILSISSVGYQSKIIDDITLVPNQTQTLHVVLNKNTKTETAVEVRSSARKESVNAMITYQKNTQVVAQVISAEAIKRSPDRNTGEILRRVPGTSVQEGRFLVVRGLSDRYNQAMLNGTLLSSTEPDRKTFSFDIFPAAMIDNIVMNKTFVPELPGEWAGGLVQVQTKDVPGNSFCNLQMGTGFNSNTIGKNFLTSQSGKYDWLGMDDGGRALPENLPLRYAFSQLSRVEKNQYGPSFKNRWKPVETSAPFNTSFQLNGGKSFYILGKKLSAIGAITYNKTNKRTPFSNIFIANKDGDQEITYQNNKYSQDVLAGVLANFTLTLNNQNKIYLRNLLNINTSNYVIDRYDGRDYILSGGGNGDRIKATEIGFKQNTFFSTQLSGEHQIKNNQIKLKWYGAFNILDQYVPDQRRLFYTQDGNDPGAPYYALLGLGAGQKSGSIFYAFLNDYVYNAGADVSRTFNWHGNHTIKMGFMMQQRDRLFDSRPFFINTSSNTIKQLSADQIFSPQYFQTGSNSLQFDEIGGIAFRYMANTKLHAGFLQSDNSVGKKMRIVWGARVERYDQLIGSKNPTDPRYVRSVVTDVLPGVNVTYRTNDKTNIRFAVSQTVIRPELRELSAFAFYDFELGAQVVGNKNATRTKVTNIDLRYEMYPAGGEMLTFGIFHKQFTDPIEYYFNRTGPGTNTFNILNTKSGTALGAELEFRKKLNVIPLLKNFTISGNMSYFYSRVKDTTGLVNRPLQGQSPYLLNLGLLYDVEKIGFTSTILVNRIGRRILFVGNEAISDIWENPRTVVDLQMSKKIMNKKGEIRINISDILNRQADFYHDLDNDKVFTKNSKDVQAISRNYGTNFNISFLYQLK